MKNIRIILLSIVAMVLAAATIVERYHGSEFTAQYIYGSWWFFALLAIVAVGAIVSIVQGKMWKRPPLLIIHAAVAVILLGGALTTLTAKHGSVTLMPGEPANQFETDKGSVTLPFTLTLDNFEVVPYPGTHSPMDFVSHLNVDGQAVDISMNNIYKRDGYRFYQEDYDDDGSSTLSVSHDPWGIGATYIGYLLMIIGLIWLLISPKCRFRQLLKGAAIIAMLFLPHLSLSAAEPPRTLPKEQADKMGQMYVLYKGRICPLQTLAKDFTTKLCGNAIYKGLSPEQVLSGWMFYLDEWRMEPMLKIKGNDTKELLGISGRYARLADFTTPLGEHPIADSLKKLPPMSPMAKNLRAADEKFNLVSMLYSGRLLKIFPASDSLGTVSWYSQSDDLPAAIAGDEYFFVRRWLSYAQEMVVTGNYDGLDQLFEKTRSYQEQRAAKVLPSPTRVKAERLYNALTTGKWLAMMAITLGLLCFAYAIWLTAAERKMPRWLHITLFVYTAALTAFLLLTFVLRWIAGGHVPMAGGFDSMNLMAIAIGIVALTASKRHMLVLPAGMLTAGFCLLVAMMGGANPPVTNLMPVLNSPLLSLHVSVIMFAYALFFFTMLNGLAGVILHRRTHAAENLKRISLAMLYPAVTLLATGIMIGAVWANVSWGNYWSWDPKEVWALITLIVYAFPLHQSIDSFRRPQFFHIYCLVAFLSVIITYFGVNFILGGMHSYS